MGIIRNLEKMHVAVVNDTFFMSNKGLGRQLSELAVEALMKGMGSAEWERYMTLFADNPEQLRRLTQADINEPDYFPRSRAYMVANAVCGAGTTGQTGQTVETTLGDPPGGVGIAAFDAVDGEFIKTRTFEVPEPVETPEVIATQNG